MKNARVLGLGLMLAGVLAVSASASAMEIDIPLPILAARSELIVVATVTDAGQPAQMEVKVPDAKQAVKAWYRVSTVKVTRVIKHTPAAAKATAPAKAKAPTTKPAAKIDTIRVIALAPPPAPKGALRPIAGDGPFYANLRKGQSYVLILRRMAGREEYFLPPHFKNCRPMNAKNVAEVRAAADVDKWPWGQAKDGLQMALLPVRRTVSVRAIAQAVRGPDGRWRAGPPRLSAYVQCVAALRNVSAKPLAVTVYPEDRFFSLTATGPDGKVVKPDLYTSLKLRDVQAFGRWATATIRPGQLIFIHSWGRGDYGTGQHLPMSPGKWKLQAGYKATRKAKVGGIDLWTGQITSKPVEITVQAAK